MVSVLPSDLGGSTCAQRQGMGGTLVPGADAVTLSPQGMLREGKSRKILGL